MYCYSSLNGNRTSHYYPTREICQEDADLRNARARKLDVTGVYEVNEAPAGFAPKTKETRSRVPVNVQ